MIKYLVLSWAVQDFLAVMMGDALLIPDVFLMSLLFWSFSIKDAPASLDIFLIWAAFAGGLLWDFRWIGFPGFFSLMYVVTFLLARAVWDFFPNSGHTVFIFFLILCGFQLPGFLASIYLWSVEPALYMRSMLLYQTYSVPMSAFFSLLYAIKRRMQNA